MPACQFCDHRNPPGSRSCKSCGAELPRDTAEPHPAADAAADAPVRGADGSLEEQVIKLLESSGKIAAIKYHRTATGMGLKESRTPWKQSPVTPASSRPRELAARRFCARGPGRLVRRFAHDRLMDRLPYLVRLHQRLAAGLSGMAEERAERHRCFVLSQQQADGGFCGREGGSDLYYSAFAVRSLALLGGLDSAQSDQLTTYLNGHD
ncbi:MAG: prenyltransferase/squalene oxidase repeat-containing protein [Planctomycetaceae bacterium]